MSKKIKLHVGVFVILTVVILSSVVASGAYTRDYGNLGREYVANKSTIVVDGIIDDAWETVEFTRIDVPYDKAYPDPYFNYYGCDAKVKMLYDDNYFYVLVVVTNRDVFDSDVFDIHINEGQRYVNGYGEYAYQMRVVIDADATEPLYLLDGSNGTMYFSDEIVVQKSVAFSNDNKTATFELALKRLNPDVRDGDVIGVEFCYEDNGIADEGYVYMLNFFRWNVCEIDGNGNPTNIVRPWQNCENFGELVLGYRREVTPAPTATATPTPKPTATPTPEPTATPTPKPTATPTSKPTATPTPKPTATPTPKPTAPPTPEPTATPTPKPTATPTPELTATPTPKPTATPTPELTATPTLEPTATPAPTEAPTPAPTEAPTEAPTTEPTEKPVDDGADDKNNLVLPIVACAVVVVVVAVVLVVVLKKKK
ncbi:MAG: hypothetical protein IKV30_06050 [Clostridia bacterium]|nr:hypothetical protein [Clostridia bacterium]